MDLRRLRYFVVLARHLHFGRAASELGVTQPGLSQQVKALEQELGVTLLNRDRRCVTLTKAGSLVAVDALTLLHQMQALRSRAMTAARELTGVLRIGYARSGGSPRMAGLVRRFHEEHPNVSVEASTTWLGSGTELLLAGELDVAFVRGSVHAQGLETTWVDTEEFVVAVSSGHACARSASIEPDTLREQPLVLWSRDLGPAGDDKLITRVWPTGCRTVVREEPEATRLLAAVAAGIGISVLNRRRAERLRPRGVTLRPIAGAPSVNELHLAWRSRDRSRVTREFVAWCRSRLANSPLRTDRGRRMERWTRNVKPG